MYFVPYFYRIFTVDSCYDFLLNYLENFEPTVINSYFFDIQTFQLNVEHKQVRLDTVNTVN